MSDGEDRLEWILGAGRSREDLARDYDSWADRYDTDSEAWGWKGPGEVAAAYRRLADRPSAGPILDAGCGTGAVGVALRDLGSHWPLVGADLSAGMLEQARGTGHYHSTVRCSLDRLPFPDGSISAVVSSGVFTHGHVGPEALAELCRITAVGGIISITQRLDVADRYRPVAERLEAEGAWHLIEITPPARFHPCRDETADEPVLQSVLTWRV
ncbi:MAG: class I SAM-dependent DNA methyltransferase [Acidimicrobiales bacterium]